MNNKIKIPDNWYQLETGEEIQDGDMWLFNNGTWVETYFSGVHVSKNTVYIRKIKNENS